MLRTQLFDLNSPLKLSSIKIIAIVKLFTTTSFTIFSFMNSIRLII